MFHVKKNKRRPLLVFQISRCGTGGRALCRALHIFVQGWLVLVSIIRFEARST